PGKLNRRQTAQANHSERLSIVGEHESTAAAGSPPKALLTQRKLITTEINSDICVQDLKFVGSGELVIYDRSSTDVTVEERNKISIANQGLLLRRVIRIPWCVLVLAAEVENERA